MLPSDRFPPPRIGALLLPLIASGLLVGCGPAPSNPRRGLSESLRVERTCRRILADLPASITVEEARKVYGHCLRVMHEEPSRGNAVSAPRSVQGPAAAPPGGQPSARGEATAQERYVYCRMHSDMIASAANRYNRSLMAVGSTQAEPDSEAYATAQQERAEALQELDAAIPERFRNGRTLVPDVLREFQGCRFSP